MQPFSLTYDRRESKHTHAQNVEQPHSRQKNTQHISTKEEYSSEVSVCVCWLQKERQRAGTVVGSRDQASEDSIAQVNSRGFSKTNRTAPGHMKPCRSLVRAANVIKVNSQLSLRVIKKWRRKAGVTRLHALFTGLLAHAVTSREKSK